MNFACVADLAASSVREGTMDFKLAETLIAPLKEGQTIARDWSLKKIEVATDGTTIEYHIGKDDLRLQLKAKSDKENCFSKSQNFNLTVLCDQDTQLSKVQSTLMSHLTSLIQRNDIDPYRPATDLSALQATYPPQNQTSRARSTFYLVPGHLGDPRDITLRALDILARVSTIFVEHGEEKSASNCLKLWNIDPDMKRIIGIGASTEASGPIATELDRLIATGEDSCLFGVDEGLPAFHDPCDSLLPLLQAREGQLDVRTTGGGSALSAAIMRVMPSDRDQSFLFLGHLETSNSERILERLALTADYPKLPEAKAKAHSYVFYSSGLPFKAAWDLFRRSTQHLDGDLCINANLNCKNEFGYRLPMSQLDSFNVSTIRDLDKLVIWIHP